MRRNLRYLFSIFIFTLSFSLCSFAQGGKDLVITQEANKVALVIGNSKYQNGFSQLSSPQNDARAMGEALKRLGFSLVGGKAHYDLTFRQMEDLLDQFTEQIKRGGVGFFYFSGHGSQDNNKDNFLIPVDTQIKYQNDLKHLALKVELVTSRMEAAENRLNILVLDACRNNPLPSGFKSGNSGLNTSKDIPSGIYVAFAARDGQTAADGNLGGYSLYTEKLLQFIEKPNERLEDIFINTRVAVKNETKNRQFPIDYGSLDGRVYFKFNSNQPQPISQTNGNADSIKEAEKFFNLGRECNSTDYDCKISNYSKSINLNPNDALAYYNRGIAYDNIQNYDQAIQDYTKAIQLDPNYAAAYNNRGSAYDNKQNYDQAIQDYNKAIQLDPNDALAYYNRGIAYRKKQNYDQAIQDYTRFIQLVPNDPDGYTARARIYDLIGETIKAEADRKKVLELEKKP